MVSAVVGEEGSNRDLQTEELAEWLKQRVVSREPTAAVRFGDGEARLLLTREGDRKAVDDMALELQGQAAILFAPEETLQIRRQVSYAFDRADVLGILPGKVDLERRRAWMEKLRGLYDERVAAGRRPVELAPCIFGMELLEDLLELIPGRRMSVVSCRDLKPVLESRWGMEDIVAYQVPSQYARRYVDGAYEAAMHHVPVWPDAHRKVASELTVRERGEVFLVGAGMFGKDLCIEIRDRGGIAIDMGSALDRFAGKVTRGPSRRALDLYASGIPLEQVALRLGRHYGSELDASWIEGEIEESVRDELPEWQARPLNARYEIIQLDEIEVEIGDAGTKRVMTFDIALGGREGSEALGIWRRNKDAGGYRRAMLDDLYRRGVHQIGLVRSRGPAGDLAGTLESIYPGARLEASVDSAEAIVSTRAALERRGEFRREQAAITLIYLALIRAAARHRKPSLLSSSVIR